MENLIKEIDRASKQQAEKWEALQTEREQLIERVKKLKEQLTARRATHDK